MSDLITTLHPQDDNSVNLYPNVKLENIIDGTAEDAGKFVKVNEEGKFIVETVNIPEPQQVNNSTVTIKQGGADKGSFTLNQAEDATIELDAGGGSNMYATNSAISKGIPAHKEAANPIQVGDTLSQLYFNTQQDIKPYLETCVDWNNGNKIINMDGTLIYPLLTGVGDGNAAGFRELKNNDYIYGLKIKADYAPGDGKVDPELNACLADMLIGEDYIDLFYIKTPNFNDSNLGLRASKNESGSGTEYTLTCYMFVNDGYYREFVIYSSNEGFKHADNWDSDEHVYRLTHIDNSNELIITDLNETYSAGWNGIFFGAVSSLGEIILSAIKIVSSSDMPYELYMLMSNALSALHLDNPFDSLYYVSAPFPGAEGSINVGWQVSADQAVALGGPKKVTSVNSAVSKIASSEANWVSVPEVLGNIYQDDILGTDEIKVNDILVDTDGTLGKVKELSEESFKNQHPENPFVIGDEIPANSYLYVDASMIPDLSKLDWSQGIEGGQVLFPLAPLEPFLFMQIPQTVALGSYGIKLNKPIYMMFIDVETCIYFQVDPSDIDIVLSSSLFEYFTKGINKWEFPEQITHEGSIFKVPLNNAEAVTLTGIIDQDVWGAYTSKDGRWVEDTPISRTKVSCETLRQLPTNYDNLDGIPILKLDYVIDGAEGYKFIPENYANKYIQDLSGIIYFCDGQELHQLEGSKDFTVKVNVRNGLTTYSSSTSPNYYSVDIGLTDSELSTAHSDYSVFAKLRNGTGFGWITPPSQSGTSIQSGSGISVTGGADIKTISLTSAYANRSINSANSGMYVMARDGSTMNQIGWSSVSIPRGVKAGTGLVSDTYDSYTDTLSLSQDTRDRLIPSTDGLDSLYKYHLVLPESDKPSSVFWEKTKSTSIGTGLVEEPTNPSEQTLKIGLSSSDLDYTQPNTKVYAKNTDSNTFGWVSLPAPSSAHTVNAGTGISVESGSTSDTISLSQEVQGKLARIPDLPSADGNYALTCTISGGVPTFAWTLAG